MLCIKCILVPRYISGIFLLLLECVYRLYNVPVAGATFPWLVQCFYCVRNVTLACAMILAMVWTFRFLAGTQDVQKSKKNLAPGQGLP